MADEMADEHDEDQHSMMLTLINRLPKDEKQLLLRKYETGESKI